MWTTHIARRATIDPYDVMILTADEEKRGSAQFVEGSESSEVSTSTSRYDCADRLWHLYRCDHRSRCPCTRSEVADLQIRAERLTLDPSCRKDEAMREERNIEPKSGVSRVGLFLRCRKKVEEERCDPILVEDASHLKVSRAESSTSTAMGEDHKT